MSDALGQEYQPTERPVSLDDLRGAIIMRAKEGDSDRPKISGGML